MQPTCLQNQQQNNIRPISLTYVYDSAPNTSWREQPLIKPVRNNQKPAVLKLATINVRSVRNKQEMVLFDLNQYNIDIAAVAETWLPGTVIECWPTNTNATHRFYNSGVPLDTRGSKGVALVVRCDRVPFMQTCDFISPRIIKARFAVNTHAFTVIGVYAPVAADGVDEERELFYSQLQQLVNAIPLTDDCFILGDFNARVGSDVANWTGVLGPYGEVCCNDAGSDLLDFSAANELRVMNSFFRRRHKYRYTWQRSAAGNSRSIIDYLLTRQTQHQNIINVRVRRGAITNSDHALLVIVAKHPFLRTPLRTKKVSASRESSQIKSDKLADDHEARASYAALVKKSFINNNAYCSLEDDWSYYKATLHNAARSVCGLRQKAHMQAQAAPWHPTVQKAMTAKKQAKQLWLAATAATKTACKQTFLAAEKHLYRVIRELRRQKSEMRQILLDRDYHKNISAFWATMRKLRTNTSNDDYAICNVKNIKGVQSPNLSAAKRRWVQYFNNLLNLPAMSDTEVVRNSANHADDNITLADFACAWKKIKTRKSVGFDGVAAEMIKYSGEAGYQWLYRICCKAFKNRKVPRDWLSSIIIPIHKKGDQFECGNYRGISIVPVACKVYSSLLETRLRAIVEPTMSPTKVGFRGGHGCIDAVYALHEITERRLEYGLPTYTAYVDFEKAFDTLCRKKLWDTLVARGVSYNLLGAIKSLYQKCRSAVRVGGELTSWFPVNCGVKQGCVLSPLLFVVNMDSVIQQIEQVPTTYDQTEFKYRTAAYADDLLVQAGSADSLQTLLNALEAASDQCGMRVNVAKTKTMAVTKLSSQASSNDISNTQYKGLALDAVDNFKYLGCLRNNINNMDETVKARINAAASINGVLGARFFAAKHVRRSAKLRVYKQLFLPVLTYGSECWTLSQKRQSMLDAAAMRPLRRIYGQTILQQRDTHTTNDDIRSKLGVVAASQYVRRQQLRWYGHVQRMPPESLAKAAYLYAMPEGVRRKPGAPPKRLRDEVTALLWPLVADTSKLSTEETQAINEIAMDREGWKQISRFVV